MPPMLMRKGGTRKMRKEVMEKRTIGDMEVSVLALGCFAFGGDKQTGGHLGGEMAALHQGVWGKQDEADTHAAIKAALDEGINFFDNAEMYGDGFAEEAMGRALAASGYDRAEYYVATKVSESYLAPELLEARLDASLARTGFDYFDLYQLHWASRAALRTAKYPERPLLEEVPLEATLEALEKCRAAGKIRHIGVCNFGVGDLKRALATGAKIVSNQICYNLLWRGIEDEVVPFCLEHGIAILPWSPLSQGLLTGKFETPNDVPAGRQRTRLFSRDRPQQRHGEAGLEDETFQAIAAMRAVADDEDEPLANVALAWARGRPAVCSVLMGARNADQVERNMPAAFLDLDADVVDKLDAAGADLKAKLGKNLDPYEAADSTRIV